MSKRTILLLILLAATLAAARALAEPRCAQHPGAKPDVYGVNCVALNAQYHEGYEDYFCSVCGASLGAVRVISREAHVYSRPDADGAVCISCGYSKPSRAANLQRAESFLADLDVRGALAMYRGTVYAIPGVAATDQSLTIGESYRIVAHTTVDGILWCNVAPGLAVESPLGWVQAGCLYVNGGEIREYGPETIGRTCRITASSARVRQYPGDYPVVGYVRRGERYTVYDVMEGSDGKWWFCISSKGGQWISAGIADIQ